MLYRNNRFEVTFGADENSRIKMAMSTLPRNKRDIRSAVFGFSSPELGEFDFELSQGKNNSSRNEMFRVFCYRNISKKCINEFVTVL